MTTSTRPAAPAHAVPAPASAAPAARRPRSSSRRKPLIRALVALCASLALLGLQAPAGAAARAVPVAGQQYRQLAHPVAASPREVVEVFWYNCAHSYQLAQPLRDWAAQQDPPVTIRYIPAAWPDQPLEMGYARLYYALVKLGVEDQVEQSVFHAVRDEHRNLTDPDTMSEWADSQGIDSQQLLAAWNSPEVQQETQAAPALREKYDVQAMPSVVVGGRYLTDPFMLPDGVAGTVPTVDYLYQHSIAEAAAAAKAPKKTTVPKKVTAPKKATAHKKANAHKRIHKKR
ncbi:thiol:disulfide interchange protein DsbA/DsbL [Streptacidiphilus carbonis]|uniref:thiol:disulfide interchange protein DsbA/DsbL n=1 Tax=Streptacidiphilus carbonis TaxID=105422 RepID=UPI0005A6453C|nr:thiol:disulfide interchange protein DsbA/DsbL [Streptacidiphilus carbonis]